MNTLVHFDQICLENGQIRKPLWISPLARQHQAMENGLCSGVNSAEDKLRNRKQML